HPDLLPRRRATPLDRRPRRVCRQDLFDRAATPALDRMGSAGRRGGGRAEAAGPSVTEIASDAPLRLGIDDRLIDGLVAVVVGGVAFFAIVGPQVLDVTNMLWLAQGQDGYTHYLGWEFFRRSPWTWPLGLNPDYGMQFSSSILFSDSI